MFLRIFLLINFICLAVAHNETDSKIVYGTQAREGQFPYMAALRAYKQGYCGGSIVSHSFVLTAAHCLNKHPAHAMEVEVGTVWRNHGWQYPVEWIVYHPQYETQYHTNDIGVVKIQGSFQLNDYVKIIPISNYNVYEFRQGVIMGYGVQQLQGTGSQYLRYAEVSIADYNSCSNRIGFPANVDVCVKAPHGDGACSGDSGGPLVSQGYVLGVASRIYPPCGSHLDVYARVDAHLNWIYQYVY